MEIAGTITPGGKMTLVALSATKREIQTTIPGLDE
jgi:hypothetical protein